MVALTKHFFLSVSIDVESEVNNDTRRKHFSLGTFLLDQNTKNRTRDIV